MNDNNLPDLVRLPWGDWIERSDLSAIAVDSERLVVVVLMRSDTQIRSHRCESNEDAQVLADECAGIIADPPAESEHLGRDARARGADSGTRVRTDDAG